MIQEAIFFGHDVIKQIISFQSEILPAVGKPKREIKIYAPPADLDGAVRAYVAENMREAVTNPDKLAREAKISEVKAEAAAHFAEIYPDNKKDVSYVIYKVLKETVRRMITVDKIRPDGRQLGRNPSHQLRSRCFDPYARFRSFYPRTDTGSQHHHPRAPWATSRNLTGWESKIINAISTITIFRRYSTGETRPMRGPGRREIGHGHLAERALGACASVRDGISVHTASGV